MIPSLAPEWSEVWYEPTATIPYLLLLVARSDGKLVLLDPQKGGEEARAYETYEEAEAFLEDEGYELAYGRIDEKDDDEADAVAEEEGVVRWDLAEEWREYDFGGRVYRIDDPVELEFRRGGTTHRVLDPAGVVHCVPSPGRFGCVIRWKAKG